MDGGAPLMDSDGPALDPSTAIPAKSTCRYLDNRSEESMDQKGPGYLWYLLFKKKEKQIERRRKREPPCSHQAPDRYLPLYLYLLINEGH